MHSSTELVSSGWCVWPSVSFCLGKIEAHIPVLFLLFFYFDQLPTPESKQHGGGYWGQSSIWTEHLCTDPACHIWDLACLQCWEKLRLHSTSAWHCVKHWGRGCHRENRVASWIPGLFAVLICRPHAESLLWWTPLSQMLNGSANWTCEHPRKIYGQGKRTGVLFSLRSPCVSRLRTTTTSYH